MFLIHLEIVLVVNVTYTQIILRAYTGWGKGGFAVVHVESNTVINK